MPGPVIPAGSCQATMVWQFGVGTPVNLVCTYGLGLALPTVANANTAFGYWINRWRGQMPTNFTFHHLELAYPLGGGGIVSVSSTTTPVAGTASGSSLPVNTAVILTKRTALAGRRGRGRMYVPGPTEANVGVAGEIAATPLANYQTQATLLLTDHAALGGMQLFHRLGSTVATPIIALQVQAICGTQRTRMKR